MTPHNWKRTKRVLKRVTIPEALLASAILGLFLQFMIITFSRPYFMENATDGYADMSMRASDYPRTRIVRVNVDLASPAHWVTLEWEGPQANLQETGPFHCTPGRGSGACDCNDELQSQINGSMCTPKGLHIVAGFSDRLKSLPECTYVTWIEPDRGIALHFHRDRPLFPASSGCIRLSESVAQMIHNNSVAGVTEVLVYGTWKGRGNRDH